METKNPVDASGLGSLPPEEQEELLLTAGDLIFKESLARLVEKMDDATAAEFDVLLATNPSEDAVMAFIEARVPGSDAIVAKAVEQVRGAILGKNPNE